ncbi:DUF6468 domain-containing protein [Pelagibacterium nitratireducens]|uniref:DUF6468 domain-containing protein n=1 Tax=Pelagibacterium nitratireducens TaxID=1046114 RepID=A0ABZ2I9Y4_9HYPH
MPLGLMIEIAVAALLATTIGYCIVLNGRIKNLQADRAALQQMIADLVQATTMANGAIKGMRETAVEADERLNSRLNEAERFAIELANHVNAGQAVMDRIAKITQAARSPGDGGDGSRAGSALKTLKDHQKRREHAA